jgi:PAS domain S-box-containing protein
MAIFRFLLLEDNLSDAEAIQVRLMGSDIKYELLRVETCADFATALETQTVDLILASCVMLEGGGIAALEIATALSPEIPFIILAASLEEERAIALLNQGATDYVLKPQLGRLVSCMQRALRETSERRNLKRTEQLLVEQKHLLQLIALGHSLDNCLAAVCDSVAQLSPRIRACFLLTDAQRLAFPRSITPNFPPSFGQGLKDAPINELAIGTCGTAVYCGEPVTCEDIAHDDRWSQGWRDLCIAHGILACHSTPVLCTDTLPVGSLMLCFEEARLPTDWEYQLAEFGAQVASIVFERDRTNLAQRKSEAKYRTLFQSMDQGFCLCEMLFNENSEPIDYRFLEVNSVFEQLTGLEQATGKTARELVPNLEADWFEIYGRVVQTGEPIRFENQAIALNRWFEVSAFRIGEPPSNQFAILFTNITDRKQLEQNRDRFLAVGSDLQVITDINGYFQWVSPTFERLLGWTAVEMISHPWTHFVHPDDIPESLSETDSVFAGNEAIAFENRYRHKDGSYRWLLWNAQPYPEEQVVYGTAVDITEAKRIDGDRKRAEQALRDSEEQNRNILESITDGFFALDQDWRFTYVNSQAERLLNCASSDLLDKVIWEVYPGTVGMEFERAYRQTASERVTSSFISFYPDHNRWYEVYAYPAADGITVYFRNVSDRIQAEAELRENEVRFRTLADNMSQFAWMTDPNGWIFWYNHRWFDYTGTTLEEMQGWGWQQVHHPDHVDRVVEHFRHCIETGETWEDTFPLRGKDGSYRWFLSRAIPIKDDAGNIVSWFGTNTDISDRKQIEAELRQKNAILDVVNESAPTPIFVKDRQGRIIYANPATLKVLGKSAAEVVGHYDIDLYPSPEDADKVMANDQRIMETGQTEVVEESPDGIRTFLGMKSPFRNEAGEVVGLVGISNDISDRKRIEAEREQLLQQEQAARETAEQANRMKDEFLAVVSHELRTPLNPILGWSKLLRSGKLSPEKSAAALETIERNAQQQAQLIDDLLDIARILQNKLTLAIAPVDLATTVTNALETVRLTAEAKSIQLRSSLAKVDTVMGDASRLQQIIWNLLSNAIKFTPENGQVEVKLESYEFSILSSQLEDPTQNSKLKISPTETLREQNLQSYAQIIISDTGKGIQPDFLPHLFEAFRQEDTTTTRKFGGLGLGLSIVQQLTTLHGGTITAASDGEGHGATFTLRLPIAPRQSTSLAHSSHDRPTLDLSGVQILVVDDIIDSQEFVVFALEQAGAIVTPASSAQMALELLTQMKPDVIISDIGMPDCNGYELLQQIRANFIQFQTTPAIALSAYASKIDQEQALAAGFQCHLAKPIDPEALIKTVATLTQAPNIRSA